MKLRTLIYPLILLSLFSCGSNNSTQPAATVSQQSPLKASSMSKQVNFIKNDQFIDQSAQAEFIKYTCSDAYGNFSLKDPWIKDGENHYCSNYSESTFNQEENQGESLIQHNYVTDPSQPGIRSQVVNQFIDLLSRASKFYFPKLSDGKTNENIFEIYIQEGAYPNGTVYRFNLTLPMALNPVMVERKMYDKNAKLLDHEFTTIKNYQMN